MNNFLADYLLFNSGNEAHEHWHMWSALSVLASCVSRKVWIDMGYFRYYPQLYIVLLGTPGTKKSTAKDIARDMVREIGNVPFSGECQSKENLVKQLSENERSFVYDVSKPPYIYTPLNIFVNELSQFIGIDPIKMVDFLVAVWNQNWYDMRTQKHGVQLITGPFLNLLVCTTPSWVTTYLKSDVITGGFSRRAIFVFEWEETKRIAIPYISPEMQAARERCIARGKQLCEVYGEFSWAPDALAFYKHWYETRTISKDPNVAYFDQTKFELVMKVAILLSLADNDSLVMTIDPLKAAMALLDKVFEKLPQVFSGIGRNELAGIASQLESMVRRNGAPMLQKTVVRELYANAQTNEIYQIIAHLIDVGRLVRFDAATTSSNTVVTKTWLATPEQFAELEEIRKKQPPQ